MANTKSVYRCGTLHQPELQCVTATWSTLLQCVAQMRFPDINPSICCGAVNQECRLHQPTVDTLDLLQAFPEQLDIRANSSATFRVAFRPLLDGQYYSQSLDVVVCLKTQRSFRGVPDGNPVLPPWTLPVQVTLFLCVQQEGTVTFLPCLILSCITLLVSSCLGALHVSHVGFSWLVLCHLALSQCDLTQLALSCPALSCLRSHCIICASCHAGDRQHLPAPAGAA